MDASPVGDAEAIAPIVAVGAAAAAAGVGYLAYEGAKKVLGDERDYSEYTGGEALKLEVAKGCLEVASADGRVMTSIQNNITHSQNIALAKGKVALIEKMNAGAPVGDATAAMEDAVSEYYSTIVTNIFTHSDAQLNQIWSMMERLAAHEDTGVNNIFDLSKSGEFSQKTVDRREKVTKEYELPNGEMLETVQLHLEWENISEGWKSVKLDVTNPAGKLHSNGYGDAGEVVPYDGKVYDDAVKSAYEERNAVTDTLSGFADDVYAEYEPDDIPTEDLVDPITAATELNQNYDGYQARAAHAAMMGIPTQAAESLTLKVEDPDSSDEYQVKADLYTTHVPTDSEGNEVGFEVGTRYTPTDWSEPLYIAYESTTTNDDGEVVATEQDFVQLEAPFTVTEAFNKDGEAVDSFQTEKRVNQTTDVSALEEELAQVRETQTEMQESAQRDDGGGGLFGGSQNILLVVILAFAAAVAGAIGS